MRWRVALCVLLVATAASAGQAQQTKKKKPVSKDDGEIYPPDKFERFKYVQLTLSLC